MQNIERYRILHFWRYRMEVRWHWFKGLGDIGVQNRWPAGSDAGHMKATEHTNTPIIFYGSTPETIAALEKNLRSKYPDLKIAGMESPPFRPLTEEEDRQAVERINASRADFVWVGLGAPSRKMEYEHQGRIHAVMLE